jgi:hypothetical protein
MNDIKDAPRPELLRLFTADAELIAVIDEGHAVGRNAGTGEAVHVPIADLTGWLPLPARPSNGV